MLSTEEIEQKLHLLTPRERKVVTHRFGLKGQPKLRDEEIAELIRSPGVSTNGVRSLITSAMQKLNDATPLSEPLLPREGHNK